MHQRCKAVESNGISTKIWKCSDDVEVSWLINLFNKILKTKKMLDEWRKSTIVPIYKNKNDIQNCFSYHCIRFMSCIMKFWRGLLSVN